MCGILGVIHTSQAPEEVFLGLQNLQHRGQDGGGIVTLSEVGLHEHRGTGLLESVFSPERFEQLPGEAAIGHTRYATIGNSDAKFLQPFVSDTTGVAIAHNGNLVNYHKLRTAIRAKAPEALSSGCDSELILWYLSTQLQSVGVSQDGLLAGIKTFADNVAGSYSVVGLLKGVGLFAFRDPNGLRPLCMGRRKEANGHETMAIASESTALEFLGYTDISDIQPGEVVICHHNGTVFREQYITPQQKHCMFEWVYFARVESNMESLSVYQARFNLGHALAGLVQQQGLQPDIVVPVPETSRIAAIALAETLNVPFREVLIKNRYVNRTFILESQAARQEAIRRKLYPVAAQLKGKKVLVVDDSIVRGNTAIKIIDLLRRAGASEIYLASTCPPIQYPCYYGIDFPNRNELLAGQYEQDELTAILGVDALLYQTLEGLQQALLSEQMCTACLTGHYPTDVSSGKEFGERRTEERAQKKEVPIV